jgi:hypothetical protein
MKALGICLFIWVGTMAIAAMVGYVGLKDGSAIVLWPKTVGTIELSQVNQMGGRYWPKLMYSYRVDGVAHKGRYINYVEMMGAGYAGSRDPGWSRDRIAPYPAGRQVVVYYDPARPDTSLLDARPISYWQAIPFWCFFLQLLAATAVMRQLLVLRMSWAFVLGLFGVFVLWVSFFIAERPT